MWLVTSQEVGNSPRWRDYLRFWSVHRICCGPQLGSLSLYISILRAHHLQNWIYGSHTTALGWFWRALDFHGQGSWTMCKVALPKLERHWYRETCVNYDKVCGCNLVHFSCPPTPTDYNHIHTKKASCCTSKYVTKHLQKLISKIRSPLNMSRLLNVHVCWFISWIHICSQSCSLSSVYYPEYDI